MSDTKRTGFSFIKIVLLALCLVLAVVVYKIREAHNRLPQLLRAAVEDLNLEEKGLSLSFEKASVTLVGSLSHPFGLRIKDLRADYAKKCNKYGLYVNTVVVPVKVMPLYKNKEIDLGLVRFSDAKVENTDLCKKMDPNFINDSSGTTAKQKVKSRTEKRIVAFFKKLKKVNADFSKKDKNLFSMSGILIYDLDLVFRDKVKLEVERFKALLGAGDVKYKADWTSRLFLEEDTKSFVKGGVIGYEDRLEASLLFQEKESLFSAKVTSFLDVKKPDLVHLDFKSVPLSFITKLRKADFAGLNLRKTWLESNLDLTVSQNSLELEIEAFKIYGDFGLIETDINGPSLNWGGQSWELEEPSQLKLQKINFFEILRERPRKKISEVFKDVGHFNALVKLESLGQFSGDFETKDFSVSVRSQGRKAYQKIQFARGSLAFVKEKSLSFKLEDVGLKNGDFEGLIEFTYDYKRKDIKTKFNIRHFKFNSDVTSDLLGLDEQLDFSLKGEGFVSKAKLTKPEKVDYQSDLNFELSSPNIKTKFWTSEAVNSKCNLVDKGLDCKLRMNKLILSPKLQAELSLVQGEYKNIETTSFSYKDKKLSGGMRNTSLDLDFSWNSKEGVAVSPRDSKKVFLRQL